MSITGAPSGPALTWCGTLDGIRQELLGFVPMSGHDRVWRELDQRERDPLALDPAPGRQRSRRR